MRTSLGLGTGVGLCLIAAPAWAADPNKDCGDTKIDINGADVLYQALGDNGEGTIGPRRLVVDQTGTIQLLGTRTFVQGTPMDIDGATLAIRKTDGRNRTEVTICTTDAGGTKRIARQFEIPGGNDNIGQTWSFSLTGLKNRRLSVRFVGKNAVHTMSYSMTLTRPGAGEPWVPNKSLGYGQRQPVVGFADLHNHQSAPEAFGGGVIAGDIGATARFPSCSHDHSRTKTGLAGLVVKAHPQEGSNALKTEQYETGHGMSCNTTVGGITRCSADATHHKLGVDALKLAHQNGLKLMLTHVVNNQALCYLAASINPNDHHCSDMESAKLQILRLKEFDAAHDWYEIVRDPWEARRAIAAGRLAVVLGVEVSNIFPDSDGDEIRQLHELYSMGVRVTYLAHESDSDFAGAAFHHWPTMLVNNELKQIKASLTGGHGSVLAWLNPVMQAMADGKVSATRNPVGLKSAGRKMVEEMMRLNMLIDVDHLSRKAVDSVYELAVAHDYYPLFAGHTRVEELLAPGHTADQTMELVADEKIYGYIADTGGMVALRTGPEKMKTYAGTPGGNDCAGSVKSFNQFYQWVIDRGYNVAFGSDLNGYVPTIGTRWGKDACPSEEDATLRAQQRGAQGSTPIVTDGTAPAGWTTYVDRGLVDIGALPSVVHDMKRLGVDTGPLNRSAEAFLVMWERTYDPARTRVPRPIKRLINPTPVTPTEPIKVPLPGK